MINTKNITFGGNNNKNVKISVISLYITFYYMQ